MAAFEKVSRIEIVVDDGNVDIRTVSLPEIPSTSDYEPRNHRDPKNEIKPWMAHFNMVRTLLGPGMLGMPVAVSSSGMVTGILISLLSGVILIHTYSLLLRNLTEIARQLKIPYISYRYGFRTAVLHGPPIFRCIGKNGPVIVATFMILSQVGICTVCVILTADSLRDVADFESTTSAMLILLPCYLVLEFFMKNIKRISYVGVFGFILNVTGLLLIIYHSFKEPLKNLEYDEGEIGGYLFTSGMCLFNLSSMTVILSIDKSLRNPKILSGPCGVINLSIGIPTLIATFVGGLGYWSFGTMEQNVLRSLPYDDISSMVAMTCYIISVTLAYPLHCYPIIGAIEEMIKYGSADFVPGESTMNVIKIICRPIAVLLTFLIAYLFPYQGAVIAFVGNLRTSILSVVFPIMMDMSLRYGVPNSYGPYYVILIKDLVIFFGGLVTWAAFEKVSRIEIVVDDGNVDIRTVSLPEIPSTSDYEPRNHRDPKNEIKPWMAHFNMVRTLLGPGMLGMPVAVSSSGMVTGILISLLSGIILIHTYSLLLRNLTEIARQLKIPYISYRYGFRTAVLHGPPIFRCIGKKGPVIVATFMILSQVGICTVCVILTSDSLRDVADFESNTSAILILLPCYLALEFFMKNIKRISYVGVFGFILNVAGLLLIIYHSFKEPLKNLTYDEGEIGGYLFTSGMCLFNLSSMTVILSIDKSLRNPKILSGPYGVINLSIGIPTLLATFVGGLGYWSFGNMEENVLRSLPYDDISSMVAMTCYIVSVTLAYPLHCYPIIGAIEEMIKYGSADFVPGESTMSVIKIICRPIAVLLTFLIAYLFPYQGPVIAFVGNLCTSMLSVVFPIMMDMCLRYGVPNSYGPYYVILIKDLVIFFGGLMTWLFGAYFCGYLIYVRYMAMLSSKKSEYF